MKWRLLFGILCIAALAACGSPGADTAFKAPTGWNSTPGIMGRFQMWMNNNQIVMLIRGDKNTTFYDAQKSSPGSTSLSDVKHSAIDLCGGKQKADYFTARGEGTNNGKRTVKTVEGVISDVGGSRYIAMYIRPLGTAADSQAEDALHSLCAK